ncbi:MAG: c-type cytochrome biogenesis protein CcsB [Microbacteriaceae bacterium]
MGVYALAFIAFAMDLARRGALATVAEASAALPSATARRAQSATAASAVGRRGPDGASSTRVATATLTPGGPAGRGMEHDEVQRSIARSASLKVGITLLTFGFVLHLAADILRGIAAARVPWANMFEFSMTGTLIIVGVFLLVSLRYDVKFLGAFISGLVLVLLGVSTVRYYVDVVPLPPALQSYWLVIHVLVASLATGMFAIGFALSVVQLLQARRESLLAEAKAVKLRFLATLPTSATLENLSYRANIVGFILWTFTLIAGAIWAEKAWGKYWGWDTKEVWTFIIWVVYAGYIHARATRGWRGSRSAWLAIIGFSAVMFNFGIVNIFFKGLHSYSGL